MRSCRRPKRRSWLKYRCLRCPTDKLLKNMTYWGLLLLLPSTPVLSTFTSPEDASRISTRACAPAVVKQFHFLFLNSQYVVSGGQTLSVAIHSSQCFYGHCTGVVVASNLPTCSIVCHTPASPLCSKPLQSHDAHKPRWLFRQTCLAPLS